MTTIIDPNMLDFDEPLHPDQQHCADLPGCSGSRGRCSSDPLHPRNRGPGVLDLRGNRKHDRRTHALCLQVRQPQKDKPVAGGFIPRIFSVLLLIGLVCSMMVPVLADVTVSFNPVGMDPDNMQVYYSNGTLVGIYNTSSQAINLVDGQSYSFLVVPANDNLMGNHPDTWFNNFVNKAQQNIIPILLLCFVLVMLGIAWGRRR